MTFVSAIKRAMRMPAQAVGSLLSSALAFVMRSPRGSGPCRPAGP